MRIPAPLTVACALAAVLVAQPAVAQQKAKISAKDCRRAVKHVPAPDVAYKPGVDVRGRKVAPADLGGRPRLKLPNVLTFDIELDLSSLAGGLEADVPVGTIRYDINSGRITFNGQPLTGPQQAQLVARCREALKGRR